MIPHHWHALPFVFYCVPTRNPEPTKPPPQYFRTSIQGGGILWEVGGTKVFTSWVFQGEA
jgi:hypothetical protein